MKGKILFFASLLALAVGCNKESYIEGVTVIATNNGNNNGNNNSNFNGNGGLNAQQISNILIGTNSSRMWHTNPNGSTVYCNNGISNPPLAMDDVWQFVPGQFAHNAGSVSSDNTTHCTDGGNYTGTWSISADNTSVIMNGSVKKLIHITETRIVFADGNYQDDLICN